MLLILIYSQVHKDYFKLCGENIVEFQGFYIKKSFYLFFNMPIKFHLEKSVLQNFNVFI